jgi:hypothetical protein
MAGGKGGEASGIAGIFPKKMIAMALPTDRLTRRQSFTPSIA